ncbi:MAG: hypothetical protein HUJ11_01160 [Arenibacter algicola]|nr:hypothetical protein [Arenibacter algicola]
MKQKISIPETLNDLTLEQYQKFLKVVDGNTDELFIRKKMVQIFCNVPLIYVEHISKADFDDITTKIIEVLNQTPELTIKFSLNNVEYGFIPSLEDDITLAEFVDLDNLTGNWEEMQQFMSILYRPIAKKKGNKYKIEPYKAKKFEDFKDMPLGIVIGSHIFFWTLSRQLLKLTTSSGLKALQAKEIQEKLEKDSVLGGVGMPQLVNSLDMTTQKLMEYLSQIFIPRYFI